MLWTAVNAAKANGASVACAWRAPTRRQLRCTSSRVSSWTRGGAWTGVSFDFLGPTRHALNMVVNVEGDNWVLPRVLGP